MFRLTFSSWQIITSNTRILPHPPNRRRSAVSRQSHPDPYNILTHATFFKLCTYPDAHLFAAPRLQLECKHRMHIQKHTRNSHSFIPPETQIACLRYQLRSALRANVHLCFNLFRKYLSVHTKNRYTHKHACFASRMCVFLCPCCEVCWSVRMGSSYANLHEYIL